MSSVVTAVGGGLPHNLALSGEQKSLMYLALSNDDLHG
jgi:hypothetical protein